MIINFVKDESRPSDLRLVAAEVLGWYNLYHDKASIVSALQTIQTDDKTLMNEIRKSIARLEGKNR
jgi:hypothetical protein